MPNDPNGELTKKRVLAILGSWTVGQIHFRFPLRTSKDSKTITPRAFQLVALAIQKGDIKVKVTNVFTNSSTDMSAVYLPEFGTM